MADLDPVSTDAAPADAARRPLLLGLLLVLATCAVFGGILGAGFVRWDDDIHVYANPGLHPVSAGHLARFWTAPYQNLYVPLSYSLYAALASVAHLPHPAPTTDGLTIDLDPRVFHAAGLMLHAANVLLVFALLRRLLPRLSRAAPTVTDGAACAGALLFAVHPVQVESVAWISEMRGLLAGLFSLAALLAYVRSVGEEPPGSSLATPRGGGLGAGKGAAGFLCSTVALTGKGAGKTIRPSDHPPSPQPPASGGGEPQASRGVPATLCFTLATLCFVLALLSKPSAVAVPLLAVCLETLVLRRPAREWRLGLAGWGGIALLFLGLTHAAQPVTVDIVTPLWTRPFIAGDALLFYGGKLLWPARLGIDYGRSPVWLVSQPWFPRTGLAAFALGLGVWAARRRAPALAAPSGLFAAALLPTLGLTPFAFQVYSTVADRYLYLALLGPALGLAWGLTLLPALPRPPLRLAARAACAGVLAAFALSAHAQTGTWRDSIALFTQALAVNPQSWGACNNLGAVALDLGRPADALPLLGEAVRLRPAYAEAYANGGLAFLELNQPVPAEADFRAATQARPDYANAYTGLGDALLAQGRAGEAAESFRQALALHPDAPKVRAALRVAEGSLPPDVQPGVGVHR